MRTLLAAIAICLSLPACGRQEPPSAVKFTESLLADMQERAFARMYQKLTSERRRDVSEEEYVRQNTAGFEKLEAFGGYFDDWQVDESSATVRDSEAEVTARVHVVFPGHSKPGEQRRKLVFKLQRENEQWKFDSFRSYDAP